MFIVDSRSRLVLPASSSVDMKLCLTEYDTKHCGVQPAEGYSAVCGRLIESCNITNIGRPLPLCASRSFRAFAYVLRLVATISRLVALR